MRIYELTKTTPTHRALIDEAAKVLRSTGGEEVVRFHIPVADVPPRVADITPLCTSVDIATVWPEPVRVYDVFETGRRGFVNAFKIEYAGETILDYGHLELVYALIK